MEEEVFETLKRDYISKAEEHLKVLERLQFDDLTKVGGKSKNVILRSEAVASYQQLLNFIIQVKVKV